MSEMRVGWVPSLPRDGGVLPADCFSPAGAGHFSAASPAPRWNIPSARFEVTRHSQGFIRIHPSTLPLACNPRMEQESLGLPSGLRTLPLPGTHAGAGTGPEHWPGITPSSMEPPLGEFTQLKQPRVARNIPRPPTDCRRSGRVRRSRCRRVRGRGSRRARWGRTDCGGPAPSDDGSTDPGRK